MKHLLVVNVFFSPRSYGGATVVAEELARRVAADGDWQVSILSFSDYGTLEKPAMIRTRLPEGLDHYTINLGGPRTRDLAFDNPAVTAMAADLIGRLRPDAAHVHCVQDLGVGVIDALDAAGVPVVLSTHDYWWLCERVFMMNNHGRFCGQERIDQRVCAPCVENASTLPRRWDKAMETLRKPRVVTYPSRHARARHEANGAPAGGVVLPNGVTAPGPDYPAMRAARRSGKLRFGYIGGPGPIKGWPMIERVFRALDPNRAELILVDAATNVGQSWWATYPFGPLAPYVRIAPGYTMETVDEFYAGLDALFFLSTWPETFGLTAREAALRGVHVIATDCGAPVEHLTHGDTATIIPGYGSARDLKAALKRIGREGLPQPTETGRAKVAAEVKSWDWQAAEVLRLLREIS